VIVPTPSDESGEFSLRAMLAACDGIGRALAGKAGYHLVVITSTVMPGATDGQIRSTLESTSGKRAGIDFGLCYSPEFIALGSVIHDLLNPDFLLIGESDPQAGELLDEFYQHVCDNGAPAARMNFVNAELTKIAVNTYVTTKITFANMLAGVCEELPGADVDTVTSAIGLDARIGRKYLKGAVGYGGPCFPRDNVAFSALARRIGAHATIAEATDSLNHQQINRLLRRVTDALDMGGSVAVLGLSYKPDTDVIEESQAIQLCRMLSEQGFTVHAYDPAAAAAAARVLPASVKFAESAAACVEHADVVIVVTPWQEFLALDAVSFARPGKRRTVIDCWRVLNGGDIAIVADYVPLGVGSRPETVTALA
jgi:UDPglucose 6-dehydrogenase